MSERVYFDARLTETISDADGEEHPSVHSALEKARQVARELAAEAILADRPIDPDHAIELRGISGKALGVVRLREVIKFGS